MPPTDYKTFRVRGIPVGTTQEGLQALIAEAVSCQDVSGIRVRSLAVDASRPREMVATFTFADIPEELSDAGGNWAIEAPPDVTLAIDTHFDGCTTLYCPPVEEWKFDLIAISGLNGHAFGSFKKKNSSYMWLRDSLPRDFPGCRVIIYGYSTKLQDSRSFQNILDIAKTFQIAIRNVRQNARKPLVLLGHSLGGIVAKEAIILMRKSSTKADRLAFAAIRGIVFFGVPNQGMDIRSLIPMVGDQPNRGFLHTLDHNSPVLRTQAREFPAAKGDIRCKILNFYETQESPTAQQNEDGIWSMSGPPAVLVNTYSATHGRPNDSQGHRVSPIDCDHSNLIKFGSAYDEPYVTVTAFLQGIESYVASQTVLMTKTEEACYQSLGFHGQYYRIDSLEPSPGTCGWLTTHELFTEWLQSSKGFIWIRGKPGSGKSMAMKHALRHVKAVTNGVVASFFIHAQGTELQRSILGLYRSLLHQLYPFSPESFSSLTMRFEEYERKHGKNSQDVNWSWTDGDTRHDLFEGLKNLCKNDRIIILVDALDEAGEDQARAIFKDLETLISSLEDDSTCQLSLCIACRHYPDISFKSGQAIVMEKFNSSDIKHVVNSRLDSEDTLGDSEKRLLKAEILDRSEGIFQWTSLVTETVIRMRQRGDSFKVAMKNLNHVPRHLDLLYRALLEPNDEQEHELKQRAKLFQWVALAAGPLTPRTLQHALALHHKMTYRSVCEYEQSDDFIAEDDFETKIKNLSRGLIQIKGAFQSGRIEFIHQSIPDFLLGHRGLEIFSRSRGSGSIALGHVKLSIACLKYLLIEEIHQFDPEPEPDRRSSLSTEEDLQERWNTRFPLVSYAWHNWIYHAVSGNELRSDKDKDFFCAKLMKAFHWPDDQPMVELWIPLKQTFGSPLQSWARQFRPSLSFYLELDDTGPSLLSHMPGQATEWPCKNARLIHVLALTGLLGRGTQKKMSSDLKLPAAPHGRSIVTPLAYALLGQQKKVVQNMVKAGVSVKFISSRTNRSALYLASLWGDREVVSLLLKAGANISSRESNSWTPLHIAADAGNVAAVSKLIRAGAKVNGQSISVFRFLLDSIDSQSPLYLAAWNGHTEAVRKLFHLGADLNLKSLGRKRTPLFGAISTQQTDMVRLLLELGADIHARDSNGNSHLHHAINDGDEKIWGVLFTDKKLFREFFPKRTIHKRANIVEILIQSGCDVNARNKRGITPLHASMEMNFMEIRDLFLSHKADPDSKTRHGEAPIHWAARHSTEATRALLRVGANVHVETSDSSRGRVGFPIHLAVGACHKSRVQLLIQAKSNVNVVNCKGETPLQLILKGSGSDSVKVQIIQLLLRAGLDINIVRNEIYSEHAILSVKKRLKWLLEAGMDLNTRDDEGETPLFWIVRSNKLARRQKEPEKLEAVQLLLRSGADPSITNHVGRSALNYAIRNGDHRVAGLLRESGSPEGVWLQDSKSSFVRRRIDKLSGESSRFFKRENSWYPDAAGKVVRLLGYKRSVDYESFITQFQSGRLSEDGSSEDGSSEDEESEDGESPSSSSERSVSLLHEE